MKKMAGHCGKDSVVRVDNVLARVVGISRPWIENSEGLGKCRVTMIEMIDQNGLMLSVPRTNVIELVKTPEELACDYLSSENLAEQLGDFPDLEGVPA